MRGTEVSTPSKPVAVQQSRETSLLEAFSDYCQSATMSDLRSTQDGEAAPMLLEINFDAMPSNTAQDVPQHQKDDKKLEGLSSRHFASSVPLDSLAIKFAPNYQGGFASNKTSSSFESTVRSISYSEDDNPEVARESCDVDALIQRSEDLQNWAIATPINMLAGSGSNPHSHLPDWTLLPDPFGPTDRHSGASGPQANLNPTTKTTASDEGIEDFDSHQTEGGLTSYPRSKGIRKELEDQVMSMLDIGYFEYMLSKPTTRFFYRQWLRGSPYAVPSHKHRAHMNVLKLDQWTEESLVYHLSQEFRRRAENVLNKYYIPGIRQSATVSERPDQMNYHALRHAVYSVSPTSVFDTSRRCLIESLYAETFRQFVKEKMIEVTRLRLRNNLDDKTYSGLGDSFCLTNPRFKDNPVVLVSPGFVATTGYDRNSVLGRNCRFLQGPGTSPQSIQRLRAALQKGEPCVELLLNYRADGTPFHCLLSVLPLFDEDGSLTYYIGGQVNVTDELQKNDLAAFMAHSGCAGDMGVGITSADFINSPLTSGTAGPVAQECLGTANWHQKNPKVSPMGWFASKLRREKEKTELVLEDSGERSGPVYKNLEDSIVAFESGYSQLILFKRNTRNVVFVTPEALQFLGLPNSTHSETYSSVLLHTDFLGLVDSGGNDRKTRNLKTAMKRAITTNSAVSFQCNLSWSRVPIGDGEQSHNFTMNRAKKVDVPVSNVVHLSPLFDGDGTCTSYVAVLS